MDDGSQVTLVRPDRASCYAGSVIEGTDTKAPSAAKDPDGISVGWPAAEADNDWFAIDAMRLKAPACVPEIEQVLRLWVHRNEFGLGQSHAGSFRREQRNGVSAPGRNGDPSGRAGLPRSPTVHQGPTQAACAIKASNSISHFERLSCRGRS
jgi:hypothetical protein